MSDWEYSEHYACIKQQGVEKRLSNREHAASRLTELGISYQSKNFGIHLIVSGKDGLIDFWPSTGKWVCRDTQQKGRGIRGVINKLKEQGQ